jgi:hypothetical protein
VAVVLTVSDKGIVNIKTPRAHLLNAAARMRAAHAATDWLDNYLPDRMDDEQRYKLIWG